MSAAPQVKVTVERTAGGWLDAQGESVTISSRPRHTAVLGTYVTVRMRDDTREALAHVSLRTIASRLSHALQKYLDENGARTDPRDQRERRVTRDAPVVTGHGKPRMEIALTLHVTDPRWAAMRCPKMNAFDAWNAVDGAALESFLHDTAMRLVADVLHCGRTEHDAALARTVAGKLTARACEAAESTGHFDERIAALYAEQEAARIAAFRELSTAARFPTDATPDVATLAATEPGVRVVFGRGPGAAIRVALVNDAEFHLIDGVTTRG